MFAEFVAAFHVNKVSSDGFPLFISDNLFEYCIGNIRLQVELHPSATL